MDKIAEYKEMIYKEAGVIGGAFAGAVAGPLLGASVGTLAANALVRRSPEIKSMHKELKQTKKDMKNLDYPRYFFTEEDFQGALNKMPIGDLNNMTVADAEALADKLYRQRFKEEAAKRISKTASLKTTAIGAALTGIPFGAWGARMSYKETKDWRANSGAVKKSLDSQKKTLNTMKKQLETGELPKGAFKENFTDHGHYHPANLMSDVSSVGCEGASYYGDVADSYLRTHNVDTSKMKWKDYNKLVSTINSGLVNEDDSVDFNVHPSQELARIKRGQKRPLAEGGGQAYWDTATRLVEKTMKK